MPRKERMKGKRGELEIVHAFEEAGFPCRRSGDTGQIVGDIEGLPDIYLEVRRRETLAIPAWLREIEDEAPLHALRALIFRRSREPWHVCLPLDQFLKLLREANE